MSSPDATPPPAATGPIVVPRRTKPARRWPWATIAVAALLPAGYWAYQQGAGRLWAQAGPTWKTVEVDRGDIELVVVEGGTLESANNATVKCQVESLLGLVGGTQNGQNGMGGRGGNQRGGARGATATPQPAQAAQPAQPATTAKTANGKTAAKGAAGTTAGAAGAAGGAAGGAGGAAGGAGGAAGTPAASTGSTIPKPNLTSFTYVVQPHTPLRPATVAAAQPKQQPMPQMGGMGGGGGMGGQQEKPGSTRILSILPEGTEVEQGEVVCTLDSANFRDELTAQQIKWDQAKSWVEQAKAMLEVAEIARKEYVEGILLQDRQLLEGYLRGCKNDLQQAQLSLDYSTEVYKKGLRTPEQYQADKFNLARAKLALREAEGMKDRLERFTAPKLTRNLEAKIDAVRADLEAQKAAFVLEDQRRNKLEKMIGLCTLRAPTDGIVVYAKPANMWGRVEGLIEEGVTVREGQPIFQIPDPTNMVVRVKVNETKVALVEPGQPTDIRVDAYPNEPFPGRVVTVTAIPAPAQGPISDVKVYNAVVDIDSAQFRGLRPGLSAEVTFNVAHRQDVTRVPINAIRWADGNSFVAIPAGNKLEWRRVKLGLTTAVYAEVLSGVDPGERVLADPEELNPPRKKRDGTVAATGSAPRG